MRAIATEGGPPSIGKTGMRNRTGRLRAIACALLAVAAGCALLVLTPGCGSHPRVPVVTEEQHRLNVESFEQVWQTIRDKHWDPTLGGLDWQAVHDELLPREEAARTMPEARAVMEEMIARLKQSHFGIIPQEIYEDVGGASGEAAGEATVGLRVRVVDGRALVIALEPGSPAESLGVRPGWEIARVGGEDIPARLARVRERFAGNTLLPYILAGSVTARLTGAPGSRVDVRFLGGAGDKVDLDLPRVVPRGNKVGFGNLPAQYIWIETRRLDGGIGYIAFNMFLDPAHVMDAFDAAMESFLDAPGVIVDLRGNPGGLGAMAMGMAGWFIPDAGRKLGTMETRAGKLDFAVLPRPRTYAGRLAVLVDGLSASTSEILAGGLQDLGRARIFGMHSAGAALPSNVMKLANGDGFQYAFANYVSAGGQVLEGAGITPDVAVPYTRDVLLTGRDAALDAAVAWIRAASPAP